MKPQLAWRKSSRCGTSTCIEVANVDGQYLIRDSKNPEQPALAFSSEEWDAFHDGIAEGEFDFQ